MRAASSASRGLPRISPSTTTTVSAPRTKASGQLTDRCPSFLSGQTFRAIAPAFSRLRHLGNVCDVHGEGYPGVAQEFLAAWRSGGENQDRGFTQGSTSSIRFPKRIMNVAAADAGNVIDFGDIHARRDRIARAVRVILATEGRVSLLCRTKVAFHSQMKLHRPALEPAAATCAQVQEALLTQSCQEPRRRTCGQFLLLRWAWPAGRDRCR